MVGLILNHSDVLQVNVRDLYNFCTVYYHKAVNTRVQEGPQNFTTNLMSTSEISP